MRIFLVIPFFLFSIVLSAQIKPYLFFEEDSLNMDSITSHGLEILLTDYFSYHYEFPKNISQLIGFTNRLVEGYPELWDEPIMSLTITHDLPRLKDLQQKISIETEESSILVRLNSNILYGYMISAPCDMDFLIEENLNEYAILVERFRSPRYFDMNGLAIIITEPLDLLFRKERSKLIKKYLKDGTYKMDTYNNEGNIIPVFIFLEYNYNTDDLSYFCQENKIFHSEVKFYTKLKSFLKQFCEANNMSRIIFQTPHYLPANK